MTEAGQASALGATRYCTCLRCAGDLAIREGRLVCTACGTTYDVLDGVPVLLPTYDEPLRERFARTYSQIATDDLAQPFEHDRAARHSTLLSFIGDTAGARVLDIGSSNAGYLSDLEGEERVALDIALPYLTAISPAEGITAVCADAEQLPVRPGYFDVIIISDLLEHLLEPERLTERLKRICRPDTRVVAHVPWKEDLAKYRSSSYEFTHLRTFDDYTFSILWRWFAVRRRRKAYPVLEQPIIFQMAHLLPLRVYDRLLRMYFDGGLMKREYDRRARWITELPRRERSLLRFYPPAFMMFELRLRPEHAAADAVRDVPRGVTASRSTT